MKTEKIIKYLVPVWAVVHCLIFGLLIRTFTYVPKPPKYYRISYDIIFMEYAPKLAYTVSFFCLFAVIVGLFALVYAAMGFKKNAFRYTLLSTRLLTVFNLFTFFVVVLCVFGFPRMNHILGNMFLPFFLNSFFVTAALVLLTLRDKHLTYKSPDTSES